MAPSSRSNWVKTTVRIEPELHRRLLTAASERIVGVDLLVNRAIEDFLDRLVPVEELR